MESLDGKRVVITGAASGLGRSLAVTLARKGCKVGVVDFNPEEAEETVELVKRNGGTGEFYRLDVRVAMDVDAMADHFFEAWGGVDLLVNDAGVVVAGFVGEIPLENWEWIVNTNLWGVTYGCHYFAPRFKKQGGGHILNVASAAGLLSLMETAPYNVTKAAIVSLSETLRVELAPYNIGVTVLCPTYFKTNLHDTARYENDYEREFGRTAFDHARLTADQVAEAAVKAVEKGKLYCVPQLPGKINWAAVRLNPTGFYAQLSFFNKRGMLRPMLLWMARKGMLQ